MSFGKELGALFRRDLSRLLAEVRAFPDDETFWRTVPGIANSAGNLVQHLEGNLREYIGRRLGGVAYTRQRDREFSDTGVSQQDLERRVMELHGFIPGVIEALSDEQLDGIYPDNIVGVPASTRMVLCSLYGHFSYHKGQIDYLRRVLTGSGPVKMAGL